MYHQISNTMTQTRSKKMMANQSMPTACLAIEEEKKRKRVKLTSTSTTQETLDIFQLIIL